VCRILDIFAGRPYNLPQGRTTQRDTSISRRALQATSLRFPAMLKRDSAEPILRALRRIIRKTSEHSRQVARDTGLSVPQSLCLRIIGDAKPKEEVTVVRVADAVQLAPATVSRLLDRLEEGKLIVRERRSQDRRKVCLVLTPLGRRRLKEMPPLLQVQFTARLQMLSDRKQADLLRALETIVELMEAVELDAAPVLDPKLSID
jgi:DNA-binding MarR family transcriptional regulator